MAREKLKRGQVVEMPGRYEIRGKYRHGKGIVLSATTKSALVCSFNPNMRVNVDFRRGSINPHIGYYEAGEMRVVGRVKKVPKACTTVAKAKAPFYEQHPFFKKPYSHRRGGR